VLINSFKTLRIKSKIINEITTTRSRFLKCEEEVEKKKERATGLHPYHHYAINPHWWGLTKAYRQELEKELQLSLRICFSRSSARQKINGSINVI